MAIENSLTKEIAHFCSAHNIRFNNTKESTEFYIMLRKNMIAPEQAFVVTRKQHSYASQDQLAKQRAMFGISEYSINDALQRSNQHPILFAMERCSDMQLALISPGEICRDKYRQSLNVIKLLLSNELDNRT